VVDDSGSVGKVLQPLVGRHHLGLPDILVLNIKLICHFPQLLTVQKLECVLSTPDPPRLVVVVQHPNEVDEFDEGLVAHYCDRPIQLIRIDLLLADAFNFFADFAVVRIECFLLMFALRMRLLIDWFCLFGLD
jgi:hypothetical protein